MSEKVYAFLIRTLQLCTYQKPLLGIVQITTFKLCQSKLVTKQFMPAFLVELYQGPLMQTEGNSKEVI